MDAAWRVCRACGRRPCPGDCRPRPTPWTASTAERRSRDWPGRRRPVRGSSRAAVGVDHVSAGWPTHRINMLKSVIAASFGTVRFLSPAGQAGGDQQGFAVLRSEDPLVDRQQRSILVPSPRRVPRLPRPVGQVGPVSQGVRVPCTSVRALGSASRSGLATTVLDRVPRNLDVAPAGLHRAAEVDWQRRRLVKSLFEVGGHPRLP
jgi:hypothetical protein